MTFFSSDEQKQIVEFISNSKDNILITFRMNLGPTRLEKEWRELVQRNQDIEKCVHWWSSTGTIGLVECEFGDGRVVYGQWALSERMQLIGMFEVDDEDVVNIKEGFDSGNVWAPEMRAIRIGETGDQD